ncbi:hypothetical protein PENTCL1PPCAC_16837, partial [Pristionchus entomophagus]
TCCPSTSISTTQLSKTVGMYLSGKRSLEKTVRRHVFPHAPSPTITSFFRRAAILCHSVVESDEGGSVSSRKTE